MKNFDLTKDLQRELYQVLIEFDKIMKNANIKYYLACGTALGCVRHKGFIPWDDDVDIYVLGKDYHKVKEAIKKSKSKILDVHDYNEVKNYPYYFPKIVNKNTILIENNIKNTDYECGIYIDVFPLIEADNNLWIRKYNEIKRYVYYSVIRANYYQYSGFFKKNIAKIISNIISLNKAHKGLDKIYYKPNNKSCYLIDSGTFGKQSLLKKDWFCDVIYKKFMDYEFPIMFGYDKYLKHYYGNYMKLPEKRKRISNHNFKKIMIKKSRDVKK